MTSATDSTASVAASADAAPASSAATIAAQPLVMSILLACGGAHLINDMIQALLPSIYPMLKTGYGLSFTQVGLITLTFQVTASLLQPWIGMYTDRHPQPWLLPCGAVATLLGIVLLALAGSFEAFLLAAALIGIGSSTFHPEASRIARMASGGRFGLAQSTFQVGGNAGSAFGPLLAAAIVVPYGQTNVGLVRAAVGAGHRGALAGLGLVSWPPGSRQGPRQAACSPSTAGGDRAARTGSAGAAGVFQILLHGQLYQLLHLLPDRTLPDVGGIFAALSVPVLGCGSGGNLRGWPDW
ncbi:MFS family permease [Herbaspirillum rubrisubalbicans]|nr:MFS family permease [Herbaspirillum rubrisubalbicans]